MEKAHQHQPEVHVPPEHFIQPPPYSPYPPPPQPHHHHSEPYATYVPGPYVTTQQPGPTSTVHIISTGAALGPQSTTIICPACRLSVTTRITKEPTCTTHMVAIFLCILGCWPCAPCVYCMDGCLNTNHYCPNCNTFIGVYVN